VGALFLAPAGKDVNSHGGHFVDRALSFARECKIVHERLDEVELARRFPQFKVIGKMIGYYEPGGGFVRPEACIEAQLDLAKQAGAEMELGTIVKQLHQELAGVRVETDRGDFHAKRVVLAAGAWLPKLAGGWFSSLRVSRQVLFWFTVTAADLWNKRNCPVFVWADGTRPEEFVYGFPMSGPDLRMKIASETDQPYTGDLENVPAVADAEKDWIYRTHVAPRLNGIDQPCVDAKTCLYTEAPYYQFIVDRHPTIKEVTVVSPCSGAWLQTLGCIRGSDCGENCWRAGQIEASGVFCRTFTTTLRRMVKRGMPQGLKRNPVTCIRRSSGRQGFGRRC
jgi:sarcosine oxidase